MVWVSAAASGPSASGARPSATRESRELFRLSPQLEHEADRDQIELEDAKFQADPEARKHLAEGEDGRMARGQWAALEAEETEHAEWQNMPGP